MSISEEEETNFFLEQYKEMNNARRDTERNRLMVLAFYITLTSGLLSFVFSTSMPNWPLSWLSKESSVGLFLFLLGIIVASYFRISRYWHCEHTEVAKAIDRMFCNGDLNLLKAAKEIVKINKEEKWSYFNPSGAEFQMYFFVLLLLFANGLVLLFFWPVAVEFLWISLPLLFILVFVGGIFWYCRYLKDKQEKFPEKSPFIMKNCDFLSAMTSRDQKGG